MSNSALKKDGARTSPISYTEDRRGCYVWTKTGRTQVVDGIEQARFSCSGCRVFKLANGGQTAVSSVKYNLTVNEWIGKPEDYQHICQPMNMNQVTGINVRRSIQAEIAAGTNETPAVARARIDAKLVRDFHVPEQDFAEIRSAAGGSKLASESALYRAKRNKFPSISTYQEFLAVENRPMWMTLRGTEAKIGEEQFGEKLLPYGDNNMLIFSSKRQQTLLLNCNNYSPSSIKIIVKLSSVFVT